MSNKRTQKYVRKEIDIVSRLKKANTHFSNENYIVMLIQYVKKQLSNYFKQLLKLKCTKISLKKKILLSGFKK